MSNVVKFDHMRVGAKGGGKHWTKDEVERRTEAGQKFERSEPKPLKVPAWLSEEAKKVWKKTVKDMKEFHILDKVDEDVLAVYCDAVAKHKFANLMIEAAIMQAAEPEPEEDDDDDGKEKKVNMGTYVKMSQSYARIILQYAEKLGLTANARARLAKKEADAGKKGKNDDLFD